MERLKLLFSDFKTAFKHASKLFLIPTYEVAGRENQKTRKQKIENRNLIKKLAKATNATYIANPKKDLKKILISTIKTLSSKPYALNPIVIMMGAGNIVNYTDLLLKS